MMGRQFLVEPRVIPGAGPAAAIQRHGWGYGKAYPLNDPEIAEIWLTRPATPM